MSCRVYPRLSFRSISYLLMLLLSSTNWKYGYEAVLAWRNTNIPLCNVLTLRLFHQTFLFDENNVADLGFTQVTSSFYFFSYLHCHRRVHITSPVQELSTFALGCSCSWSRLSRSYRTMIGERASMGPPCTVGRRCECLVAEHLMLTKALKP